MENKKLFLEELQRQYDKDFELKERLEGKAGNLLTIAGITIPLLFGFSSFLIEKLDRSYIFLNLITILIVIGIFAIIASIFSVMFVFRLKNYRYVMFPNMFYNENGSFNNIMISDFSNQSVCDFITNMIENYLRCIKQNGENNDKKADILNVAQWVFLGGMTTIPITVGILLFYLPKSIPNLVIIIININH